MSRGEIDPTEAAVGAAIARQMDRAERNEEAHIRATRLSGTATAISVGFVAIASIGMLVVMMVLDR